MISIITPLYNKGKYISEMIKSIKNQTYTNWELIIVDNGSTDRGLEIAKNSAFEEKRIKVIQIDIRGPGKARNAGYQLSKGEYICFLDADDYYSPEHLEIMFSTLIKRNADIAVSQFVEKRSDSEKIIMPPGYNDDYNKTLEYAFVRSPWAIHAALIDKKIFATKNPWDERADDFPAEDNLFWYKNIIKKTIAWSASKGAVYRLNVENSRNEKTKNELWVKGMIYQYGVKDQIRKNYNLPLTEWQVVEISRSFENMYLRAKSEKDVQTALEALKEAQKWIGHAKGHSPKIFMRKYLGIKNVCLLLKLIKQKH